MRQHLQRWRLRAASGLSPSPQRQRQERQLGRQIPGQQLLQWAWQLLAPVWQRLQQLQVPQAEARPHRA
jgi:hypothetical protein